MPDIEGFPPTRDEWLVLRDRARFAEDRVRIVRSVIGHREGVTWNVVRLRRKIRQIRWALATARDEDPEP